MPRRCQNAHGQNAHGQNAHGQQHAPGWKRPRGLVALIGALVGACISETPADPAVERVCAAFCEQREACDDELAVQACREGCYTHMNACDGEERRTRLTRLQQCASESCDDIVFCALVPMLQCRF